MVLNEFPTGKMAQAWQYKTIHISIVVKNDILENLPDSILLLYP